MTRGCMCFMVATGKSFLHREGLVFYLALLQLLGFKEFFIFWILFQFDIKIIYEGVINGNICIQFQL